jgi:amidohydrolase
MKAIGLDPALRPEIGVVEEAVALRRRLHRRPELSGCEHETTTVIRERIRRIGLTELPCPTPTGAVALLDTGRPGGQIMLRADIDAVPVTEASGVPFASQVPGRMHGCGHDGHTAILLAVAETLVAADGLSGSYSFCFQPAEETLAGARAMVEGGLLEAVRPDRVIGLHLTSLLPSGTVYVRQGIELAWAAGFRITLHGEGGHNATDGRSLIHKLGEICVRVPEIAEGLAAEGASAIASVGEVSTDGTWNTSPTQATLSGTHRAFSAEHDAVLTQRLRGLVKDLGAELEIMTSTPAVLNDGPTVRVLHRACADLGVPSQSFEQPLVFADDVAEFMRRVPGCYFLVGARPPDLGTGAPHHSPKFRIDEGSFGAAIAVLATLAARLAATTNQEEES